MSIQISIHLYISIAVSSRLSTLALLGYSGLHFWSCHLRFFSHKEVGIVIFLRNLNTCPLFKTHWWHSITLFTVTYKNPAPHVSCHCLQCSSQHLSSCDSGLQSNHFLSTPNSFTLKPFYLRFPQPKMLFFPLVLWLTSCPFSLA